MKWIYESASRTMEWRTSPPRRRTIVARDCYPDRFGQIRTVSINFPWMAWGRLLVGPHFTDAYVLGALEPIKPSSTRLYIFDRLGEHFMTTGQVCLGDDIELHPYDDVEDLFFNTTFNGCRSLLEDAPKFGPMTMSEGDSKGPFRNITIEKLNGLIFGIKGPPTRIED